MTLALVCHFLHCCAILPLQKTYIRSPDSFVFGLTVWIYTYPFMEAVWTSECDYCFSGTFWVACMKHLVCAIWALLPVAVWAHTHNSKCSVPRCLSHKPPWGRWHLQRCGTQTVQLHAQPFISWWTALFRKLSWTHRKWIYCIDDNNSHFLYKFTLVHQSYLSPTS